MNSDVIKILMGDIPCEPVCFGTTKIPIELPDEDKLAPGVPSMDERFVVKCEYQGRCYHLIERLSEESKEKEDWCAIDMESGDIVTLRFVNCEKENQPENY